MNNNNYDCVVVFSGGLDSTTILLDCLKNKESPLCVLFDYGQKHKIELSYAKNILNNLDVPYVELKIPTLNRDDKETMIVGNRNIIFLSYAHYIAKEYSISKVYCGFCEGDDSGFPDCRKNFINSVQNSLDLGYGEGVEILTPLLGCSKSETYFNNYIRGDLKFVVEKTLTCYHGEETQYQWGRGCGECMSCLGRIKGFNDFKEYYLEN